MLPDLPLFQRDGRTDLEAYGQSLSPNPTDARTMKIQNSLSRHMALLRRRNQSSSRWHALAILTGALLALGMAGVLAR
jgi:hypothetical protein